MNKKYKSGALASDRKMKVLMEKESLGLENKMRVYLSAECHSAKYYLKKFC